MAGFFRWRGATAPRLVSLDGVCKQYGRNCAGALARGTISRQQDCPRQITENRGSPMPTSSQEYRRLADECLEVVNKANEWYVRVALLQMAAEFKKRAEHLEQRRAA